MLINYVVKIVKLFMGCFFLVDIMYIYFREVYYDSNNERRDVVTYKPSRTPGIIF